jgi:phosphatidylglycerophosphate synthase
VWALLALGFVVDSADGQLARLRGQQSVSGEWLDHVVDTAKFLGIHAAVLVAWARFFDLPGRGWLLVPLAFQAVSVLIFVGGVLTEVILSRDVGKLPPEPVSLLRASVLLFADFGVFCLVFLLLGWPSIFVAAYTFLAAANFVLLIAFLRRWFLRLKANGRPKSGL